MRLAMVDQSHYYVDYKAFQTVMNSMIQGAILGERDAADLVAEAAEELEKYK